MLRAATLAVLVAAPVAACQTESGEPTGLSGPVPEPAVAMLAGSCANCHGTDGRSPAQMPTLAGASYATMKAQLEAFKAGSNPTATVMTRLTKGYSDAEIEALAKHFSSIKK
jgi:cytochrome subunit of sulfide dehydrogenase